MKKRIENRYPDIDNFGSRLIYLYDDAGLLHDGKIDFTSVAKSLYENDKGLRVYSYDADDKTIYSQTKNTADKLRKDLLKTSCDDISGTWLNIYCKFFGCSCDFLMGYIKYPKHDNTNISSILGLSDSAINVLTRDRALYGNLADTLNATIGNIKTAKKGVPSNAWNNFFDDLYTYLKADNGSLFYFDNNPDDKRDTVWFDAGGYDVGLIASRFDGMLLSQLTSDLVQAKKGK